MEGSLHISCGSAPNLSKEWRMPQEAGHQRQGACYVTRLGQVHCLGGLSLMFTRIITQFQVEEVSSHDLHFGKSLNICNTYGQKVGIKRIQFQLSTHGMMVIAKVILLEMESCIYLKYI